MLLHFDSASLHSHTFPREMFLVEPFLPSGGVSMIHGVRGHFKTCLAFTLALAVVRGSPFLGRFTTAKGSVAFVQLDLPYQVFQQRAGLIHGLMSPEEQANMHYFLSDRPIDILAASAQDTWVQVLKKLNPDLLIVDTLRKCHRLDENSSNTPTPIYGAWREICGEGTTMLFLHHNRREYPEQENDFRGTGAWQDDIDMAVHIRKIGRTPRANLEFARVRTVEDMDPMLLELEPDTMLMQHVESPNEVLHRLMREGVCRADIVKTVTDVVRWSDPMPVSTAYRKLKNYEK